MYNKKQHAFLLLECLLAQAIFILFTTSFIACCGYLLKAHYQAIASLQALDELVIAAEEGVGRPSVTVASIVVTLQLQNSFGGFATLQGTANYYTSNKLPTLGFIRYVNDPV